jgi:hypothetical protein
VKRCGRDINHMLLVQAPEVLQGKPYNEKADVFSFAMILYQIMCRCAV